MSRRRELERELRGLGEIRGILDAMRSLAMLETRKLQRFLAAQRRALDTVTAALREVAAGQGPAPRRGGADLLVLVGSERGFCGDFNEALVRALGARRAGARAAPRVAVLGERLASRLGGQQPAFSLPGATVAEDIDTVIRALAGRLEALPLAGLRVSVLAHDPGSGELAEVPLEPLPEPGPAPRTPPRLNLPRGELLAELAEGYLLGRLQALLYGSLLAENERRMRHMDAAIRHLDDDRARLHARHNALRQEEITEEIEVIMLSAERLRSAPGSLS